MSGFKTLPAGAIEHRVFAGKSTVQMQELREHLKSVYQRDVCGGIRLTTNGPHFVLYPQPLDMVETSFYFVRDHKWDPAPSGEYFPFRMDHPEGAIVPLAGGIYIGQRKLSDNELETVGLTAVRDEEGNKITFPYFAHTKTRVLMDTWGRVIPGEGESKSFLSCGLQFKGVGSSYCGRLAFINPDGSFPFRAGEGVLKRNWEIAAFVGFPELIDKYGIFLDQIHQPPPSSPDPVGGMIGHDIKSIEIDELLSKNGAVMACKSLSSIKLLEQSEIQNKLGLATYQSGDLYVLLRAAGKDTRRLSHLIKSPGFYKYYIKESYGDDFEAGRAKHLNTLCENMGKNIRAVLKCMLTISPRTANGKPVDPNTDGNLNPKGAIYDSSELVPAEDLDQVGDLISYWIKDLVELAENAELPYEEFIFDKGHMEILLKNIFGREIKLPPQLRTIFKEKGVARTIIDISFSCVEIWKLLGLK